jgi:thiamine-monophosphate kinase
MDCSMLWQRKSGLDHNGMTSESAFIALMRQIATGAAARGLQDDAAVFAVGGETLIVTHDMMVQGVHWLYDANPADVAWKLVAVNLSDLAAKGARPIGVLLGYMLGDDEWDRAFAAGLANALAAHDVPLLGGDTTGAGGHTETRSIGMTALGVATCDPVPSRNGAQVGDTLYVTGALGDAKAGFDLAVRGERNPVCLVNAFNRPIPLLVKGQSLAPVVNAMMDISDGLLLDASRMAAASGLRVEIDLASVPLSLDYIALHHDNRESRMIAVSWGDDYQLLFAAPANSILPVPAFAVGQFSQGAGLALTENGTPVDLPSTLGFEHGQ